MSSPIEKVEVRCPGCGTVYEAWDRRSVTAEQAADPEYMRRVTTATCPSCGRVVELDDLTADGEGVRHA